ncbi:MAG: DNA ligase [Rickettsiales bacterium]|nr:DNA ligase [Rickettsiales bacterium]
MKRQNRLFILFFCSFFLSSSQLLSAPPALQLANIYHKNLKLDQFYISEKLDGVRGYWDGEKLISRQGNIINAPKWFTKCFPENVMDGELWIARGKFELVSKIIRKEIQDENAWHQIHFMVFDLPNETEVFANRFKKLRRIIKLKHCPTLRYVDQFEIDEHSDLMKVLDLIVKNGGEGLMLHRKDSLYTPERNDNLFKLKTFEDAEATVISYVDGKGKYKGKLGALIVENDDKIQFKIGSGFSDEQRKNPPQIGSRITYKFFGKTKNGVPRFASFWRERNDF